MIKKIYLKNHQRVINIICPLYVFEFPRRKNIKKKKRKFWFEIINIVASIDKYNDLNIKINVLSKCLIIFKIKIKL